ncbi:MAG: hypothetical protein FWD91_07455, partial [Treponema sp.]|nr:hypothetical protein [Treponema sp.]
MAVPLSHPIYHVLEQAQLRGLIRTLPSVRPFSGAQILALIPEILNSETERRFGTLTEGERNVLRQFRQELTPARDGVDLVRGTISGETADTSDVYISWEFGFGGSSHISSAYFQSAGGFRYDPDEGHDDRFFGADHPSAGDFFIGTNSGIYFSWKGDLGRTVSYGFTIGGAFIQSPRSMLGITENFGHGWKNDDPDDWARAPRELAVFSEPLTYFPFSYTIGWEGSVWFLGSIDADGFEGWPQEMSVSYYTIPEMAGSLLNGHVVWRFASHGREWGGMARNSSLILNQTASPFFAGEIVFMPLPWFSFSALTGVLEYGMMIESGHEGGGIKSAAETFQNAFSINMLEANFRYFYAGFGTASVWPKRYELGQMFPLVDSFLYQGNTGDFDNSALFLNLAGMYPGLGKLWLSFFADEISLGDINRNFFNMSRMMVAYQFGLSIQLPIRPLSFSSLTLSYTKIEPFTYSHTREDVPWYQGLAMETNWVNRGRSLGHYLPPNSDEILVR